MDVAVTGQHTPWSREGQRQAWSADSTRGRAEEARHRQEPEGGAELRDRGQRVPS